MAKANSDLVRKNNELELVISTLNNNKKELEQLIVTKIKENDMIQREAADKLAEAEKRLKDAESINDNFFIETIHEMRTPLSLVLGSLALVVQNDDPEKDMSTQLLSAYRNTLAMQDLADQLIGTHRSNDVANYLRIARYDMVEIARQICDIFVDWVAMNNIDFRYNTQTPALWVWMDRRKMEFALRMLLSNAFKNTFVYGKVTLDISVVNENGKAYSALVVTDEGLDEDESTRRGLKQIMDMADAIGRYVPKRVGQERHFLHNHDPAWQAASVGPSCRVCGTRIRPGQTECPPERRDRRTDPCDSAKEGNRKETPCDRRQRPDTLVPEACL